MEEVIKMLIKEKQKLEEKIQKIDTAIEILNNKAQKEEKKQENKTSEQTSIEKEDVIPKQITQEVIQEPEPPLVVNFNKRYAPYTKKEIDKILSLAEKGYSTKQIAEMTGRTYSAIKKKLYDMGFRKRKSRKYIKVSEKSNKRWTKTDIDMLKGMYLNGYRISSIAGRLGRTPKSISDRICILRKAGELD